MSPYKIRKTMVCGVAACLLAIAGAASAPAAAGTLQVDPVRLEISRDRRTASVTVRNQEQVPVTIRAYALEWSQAGGEDVYEDSSAVIVSPPVFTIAPGGTQIVRVGLRSPSAAGRAYRLMIEEVPDASPGGGIRVALRLNLPLFAMMNAGSPSDIGWAAWRDGDGRWVLEAANNGSGYVRIEPDQAKAATGIDIAAGTNFGVVLPGSRRQWTLGERPGFIDQARFETLVRGPQDAQPQPSRHSR